VGHPLIGAFIRDYLHIGARAEFWGFSPGILGIGWLPAVLIVSVSRKCASGTALYGLDRNGKAWVLIATLIINAVIALAMIDGQSLVPTFPPAPNWTLAMIKSGFAVAITSAFLLAFFAARWLGRWVVLKLVAEALSGGAFGVAGAVIGLAVVWIRAWFGAATPVMLNLPWMHAGGFALAYAAGASTLAVLRYRLPGVVPDRTLSEAEGLVAGRKE
jgi:hypothetical protein